MNPGDTIRWSTPRGWRFGTLVSTGPTWSKVRSNFGAVTRVRAENVYPWPPVTL